MGIQNNPVEQKLTTQANINYIAENLAYSPDLDPLDDLISNICNIKLSFLENESPNSLNSHTIISLSTNIKIDHISSEENLENEVQVKEEKLKQNDNLAKLDEKESDNERKIILFDRKERAKNIAKQSEFISLKQVKIEERSFLKNKLPENADFVRTDNGRDCIHDLKKNKLYLSGNDIPKKLTIDGIEYKCKDIRKSKKFSHLESLLDDYGKLQNQIDSLQQEIDRLQHEIEQDILREEEEKKTHHQSDSLTKVSLKETEKDRRTNEKDDEKHNKYIENIKFAQLIGMVVLSYIFNKHQEDKRNYDRREKESQDKHDAIKRDELKKEIRKEERVHKELDLESIKRSSSQV